MSGSRRTWIVAMALAAMVCGCTARADVASAPAATLVPCASADCLRVMTWNLHAIPFVSPRPTWRLRNVAAKIAEQQPDVVLLQEVWTHAYADLLERALGGAYRMTRAAGCRRPYPCGGLVVLVRVASGWTASAPTFVPFDAAAPWYRLGEWDGIAKKGMLLAQLRRGDATLGVVDLHLQTRYPEHGHHYRAIRRRQLEQLAATLDATFAGRPAIVAGDFNTAPRERSGLYATHIAPLGDDRTAALRAACPHCGTRAPPKFPRWIDYVITRGLAGAASLTLITNDAIDDPYSDHHALLLRLEHDGAALR